MRINAGLDTGDMLLKWETEIGEEETAVELGERLAVAGAELLAKTLDELAIIAPEPQDDAQASFAPILKKEDGHVNWSSPRHQILNRIRGFTPWPGCYGFLNGSPSNSARMHVWKARAAETELSPGSLLAAGRRLYAGCGDGSIELLEVQLEGKKRMDVTAFLNGFSISTGEVIQ
jgi:methionyl-tRNA formyltransferase